MSFKLTGPFWIAAFAFLAASSAHAQIALYAVTGTTETPVTSVYGFGQIAQGDTRDIVFRAKNTTNSPVVISKLAMSGTGFSIVNNAIIPFTVAPGNSLDFTMHFAGTAVNNYNANLQVNTLIVTLLASVVVAPSFAVASPCTGPDAQGVINFGRLQEGATVTCTVTLTNPQVQDMTVSPITVTGSPFSTSAVQSLKVLAGQSATFLIKFGGGALGTFNGVLTAGVRIYTLTGTVFTAPLSAPQFSFDTQTMSSGEQHSLSIQLASPAPVTAAGTITLGFTPSTSGIADDSAVQFVATSKRVASFTVGVGQTSFVMSGKNSIVFSTGTTAGKITFTVDAGAFGISGNVVTSVTVSPSPVVVTAGGASRTPTGLKVTLSGFDNTYSVSALSFAFYDKSGAAIGTPVTANVATNFQSFYQGQIAGSSFLLLANFPVTGDATQVGAVDVTATNTAGATRTQRMSFP